MSGNKLIRLNLFLFAILIGIVRCSNNSTAKSIYKCQCDAQILTKVSFNEILINPMTYDNKFVEIEGVYKGQFEQSALFKRRQNNKESSALWVDFGANDSLKEMKSGIYLSATPEEINTIVGKQIRIRGIFDIKSHGHLSQYFGTIKDICYLEVL